MDDLLRVAHDIEDGLRSGERAASPPTMIESVPLIAPMSPPLTGASSIVAAERLRAVGEAPCHTGRDAAHVDDDGAWLQRA